MAYSKKSNKIPSIPTLNSDTEDASMSNSATITSKSNLLSAYSKEPENSSDADFASDLIKQVNKDAGLKIAFDLTMDDSPTNVKRWIPSGSQQLDYIMSNFSKGGYPEGRIIEVCGQSGIGKSTLMQILAANTQKMGGIVVYIDTENATSKENLRRLGVDIKKNFVFIQEVCTEEIFKTIESVILKAKGMKKDVPVVVIWDSIAASSPKGELEGEYDQNTIGLQARVLRKGLRKINQLIGNEKVLLVLSNHITQKVGVVYGNPEVPTGGTGPGFFSTIRIKLSGGSQIKDGDNILGINVVAKTFKNRLTAPFREVSFRIMFGKGIEEDDEMFDVLREWCDKNRETPCVKNGKRISVSGTSTWKVLLVTDQKTGEVLVEKKFLKSDLSAMKNNPEYKEYFETLIEAVYVFKEEDPSTALTMGTAEENQDD